MSTKKNTFIRFSLCAVLLVAGNACILSLAASPAATPEAGVPTATAETGEPEASVPTAEASPTLTPEPTATQTHTPTVEPVTLTAGQNLSCVTGPHWILYEWMASIPLGETVELLARSAPEGEEYYYVRKADGTECWAFGGSSVKSGDAAGLPIREAPPLPAVTLTIQNGTYLHVGDIFIRAQDSTTWGADRLGSGVLNPQATFTLSLAAGFYDVVIKDNHGLILYDRHDGAIGAEPGSRSIVLAPRYPAIIHSVSTMDFCRITIDPYDWGTPVDVVIPGDGRIVPGETVTVEALAGTYNAQFRRCGDDMVGYGIGNLSFLPTLATYTIH